MHDNKRFGKKLTTIIWVNLAIAPLILFIFAIINVIFKGNKVVDETLLNNLNSINFNDISSNINNFFGNAIIPTLQNTINNVFDLLGLDMNDNLTLLIPTTFAWAIQINIIHVSYDLLNVLFKIVHNFFGKVE